MAAAAKVTKLGNGVWGHNVPLSNKDFTWYFLYHGLHNRGIDIISKDQSKVTFNDPQATAALQFYVDLITSTRCSRRSASTTARPACRCSRPGGSASCTTSRCGSPVFRAEKLPFKWDFVNPVGVERQADDLLDDRPLGDGVEEQEQGRRLGASSSSCPRRRSRTGSARTTAGRPVRSDVNTSKGDAQVSGSTATC